MTPEELERRLLAQELGRMPTDAEFVQHKVEELQHRKAEALRMAVHHRASQAGAAELGDKDIARTLGLLAAHLEQAAALAEAEIRDRAAQANAHRVRMQKQVAASKPRPSRKPKVKGRITTMMLVEKAGGTTFKTLMQRWEREPLDGLRLVEIEPGIYGVDDEDAEGITGRYKATTLQKMFSPKA